jgi:hypothetical protein
MVAPVATQALPDATLPDQGKRPELDDLAVGFLLGLLVGEGHFGGDGRQPQVTLRMHIRHEQTFEWLRTTYPGSALYGPYHHGGRSYYQWSARGRYLREVIVPLVQRHRALLDAYTATRFDTMCERYAIARDTDVPAPQHQGRRSTRSLGIPPAATALNGRATQSPRDPTDAAPEP